MIGRCDNCGREGRLHRWERRFWICDLCIERMARARGMVERLFRRAA